MYCPSCGSEQIQELKYCNRCGANLSTVNEGSTSGLSSLVWAVSLVTALVSLGGLVMIFIFAMELMSRGNSSSRDFVLLIFFLLVVLGISALLIRLLSRLLHVYLQSGDKAKPPQANLSERLTAELPEMRESNISATEQTTRRLEPANIKKD